MAVLCCSGSTWCLQETWRTFNSSQCYSMLQLEGSIGEAWRGPAWILREVAAITSGTIAFGLLGQDKTQDVFHIVAQILRENSRDMKCVKPSIQYIPVTFWTVQNGATCQFCTDVARKIPPSLQREANLLALALLHPLR